VRLHFPTRFEPAKTKIKPHTQHTNVKKTGGGGDRAKQTRNCCVWNFDRMIRDEPGLSLSVWYNVRKKKIYFYKSLFYYYDYQTIPTTTHYLHSYI
jgi:hypothetical protein